MNINRQRIAFLYEPFFTMALLLKAISRGIGIALFPSLVCHI